MDRDLFRRCGFGTILLATVIAGCNRRNEISKLSFNVSQATDAVLSQYDANHDGKLSKDELAACPGIKQSIMNFDTNNDGTVDGDELRSRFKLWLDSPTRLMILPCVVKLDGRPLSNATVKLVPEKFLADSVWPGEGTTGEDGLAGISVKPADAQAAGIGEARGMRLGLYLVTITHPSVRIPAKYNSNTTLGVEISPASSGSPVMFSISSR